MRMRLANRMMLVGAALMLLGAMDLIAPWSHHVLPVAAAPTLLATTSVLVLLGTCVLAAGAATSAWTLWREPAARTRWNVAVLTVGGPAALLLTTGMLSVGAQVARIFAQRS